MKREELEKHLGQKVKLKIFDGSEIEGELHRTGEKAYRNDLNLYLPNNWYFLEPERVFLFRCSHVKKLEEL